MARETVTTPSGDDEPIPAGDVAEVDEGADDGAEDDADVGAEDAEGGEPEPGDDAPDAEDDAAHAKTFGKAKLDDEQMAIVGKAFGRKTAEVREAREKREQAEKERDDIKAEAERLRSTVGNEVVLRAAQAIGVHPETITETEAKAISENASAAYWRDIFESSGDTEEGWTGVVGGRQMTYTAQQCRQQARQLTRQIEGNTVARRAQERASAEMAELFELGKAAKKAGVTKDALKTWKPGTVRLPGKPTPPAAGAARHTPPPVPRAGAGRTSPSAPRRNVGNIDWRKVGTEGGISREEAVLLDTQRQYNLG
jgi:hypothetical protein